MARTNIMKKFSSNVLASIIAPTNLPIKIGSIVENTVDTERSTICHINCFLDFDQYLKIMRAEFIYTTPDYSLSYFEDYFFLSLFYLKYYLHLIPFLSRPQAFLHLKSLCTSHTQLDLPKLEM